MFSNCNQNLKYCINDNLIYNDKFIDALKIFQKNCSDICIKMNLKKYIMEKYLCIDDCSLDNEYTYDYNNICYKNCPKEGECNKIAISINSTISNRIIDPDYHDSIYQVIVNEYTSNIENYESLLNEGINNVTIKFNRYLDTCSNMFSDLNNIVIIDTYNFYSSNVKDMSSMFYGCSSLKTLDLQTFNTSSVTSMSRMLEGCSSLTSIDMRTFDTLSVTDMSYMFSNCNSLKSLDLSAFGTSSVTVMHNMFYNCFH
jgi:surface protein